MLIENDQCNIAENLARCCRLFPDKTALIFEEKSFTYRKLDEMCNQIANGLSRLGIAAGDRVALLLPNIPEFVTVYFGVQKLGAVAVLINTMLKPQEITFILKDSGACALLTTEMLRQQINAEALSRLKHIIFVNDINKFSPCPVFQTVMRTQDDHSAILYTSGTTGFPKGAIISHSNIIFDARTTAYMYRLTPEDRILLFAPLFHSFTLSAGLNTIINTGASLVLCRDFDPEFILCSIAEHNVTCLYGSTPAYTVLLKKASQEQMRSVRFYISGGASMPNDLAENWLNKYKIPIFISYGLTECSQSCFNHFYKYKIGSVGSPVEGVSLKIVDDTGQEVLQGKAGVIIVRGPKVTPGYWNRYQESAEVIRDGWFHTGDIGYVDKDDYVFITDRKKDMINVGGQSVYPSEVENVLNQHPAIAEAAVYGVKDELLGEQVQAAIVLNPSQRLTDIEITEFCRPLLAHYKLPSVTQFMPSLPKNKAGKILKRKLREKAEALLLENDDPNTIQQIDFNTVSKNYNDLYAFLKKLIQNEIVRIIGIRPGNTEDFFHSGMNSLQFLQLGNNINILLGSSFPVTLPMKYPCVEQLTEFLAQSFLKQASNEQSDLYSPPVQADQKSSEKDSLHSSSADEVWHPQLYNQQECYVWYEQFPDKAFMNVCMPIRMTSSVDKKALEAALQTLVKRHQVLRTIYSRQNNKLLQRVLDSQTTHFETINITTPSWKNIASIIEEAAKKPFNLEQGPLLRAYLFSRKPNDHLFLIVAHHIALDATTFALLLNELFETYKAHHRGQETLSPQGRSTFLDYVQWQTAMLQDSEGERLWQYWKNQMAGDLPLMNMPMDYPRPSVPSHNGDCYFFEMDATLTNRLRNLAKKEKATLYMLMLTVFQLLLYRYTKQKDIIIAAHTLNRTKPEYSNLIAYLSDTVAIRTQIPDQVDFREIFKNVRNTVLEAIEHQGYPMKLLEKRLQLQRNSLCNIWFTMIPQHLFQNAGELLLTKGKPFEIGGLNMESMNDLIPPWLGIWYELELNLIEGSDGVSGTMVYSTDLFKETTIVNIMNEYKILLNSIADDLEIKLF
jgi:long-chain acyl-CoA synthetase